MWTTPGEKSRLGTNRRSPLAATKKPGVRSHLATKHRSHIAGTWELSVRNEKPHRNCNSWARAVQNRRHKRRSTRARGTSYVRTTPARSTTPSTKKQGDASKRPPTTQTTSWQWLLRNKFNNNVTQKASTKPAICWRSGHGAALT